MPEDGGPGGATTDAVSIMSANAGPMKVKASGGIYSREDLDKMVNAGASRIGTSSGVEIIKGEDFRNRLLMKNSIKKILKEEIVDITDIQDDLLSIPLDLRRQLKDELEYVLDSDGEVELGEQISYKGIPEIKAQTTIGKILKWVKRYITDKATNFLINASMNEIKDTIDLLDVMDPTDTTSIFTPKAMYLGGGIDFAR